MTTNLTKGQLLNYHRQLQQMYSSGDVLIYLLRSRIQEFNREFGIRIQTLQKEEFELAAKFYVTEKKPDGKGGEVDVLVFAKTEDGKPTRNYQPREGADIKEFERLYNEFKSSPVTSLMLLK